MKIGTNSAETIRGTTGNDQITGKGGNGKAVGREGNDTYYYADGFGVDTVNDTSRYGHPELLQVTTGVNVYLLPEWGEDYNAVYDDDGRSRRRLHRGRQGRQRP